MTERTEMQSFPQRRRRRALELLSEGASKSSVAAELEVQPSTVWRWLQDPSFAAELRQIHEDRLEQVEDRLQCLAKDALEVMATIMMDAEAPHAVRLRAASEILERAGIGTVDARVIARVDRELNQTFTKLKAQLAPNEYERVVGILSGDERPALSVDEIAERVRRIYGLDLGDDTTTTHDGDEP